MLIAFTDENGGFYQAGLADENDTPAWAEGMTRLTEAQRLAELAANQPDPALQVKGQIEAIETATKMNRATREFMLEQVVRETARDYNLNLSDEGVRETVQAGLYAGNVAYRRIKDIDDQIAALRAQIGEL